jgi:HD-GYP domain-containing protein (c-di-GMP phosphodiesterase class II)
VLQHHECLDGSGYPEGLAGDDIRLEAQIIAVADTVEVMSSHRPYCPALGIDAALGEIESRKGEVYEPVVVDTCIALSKEKGFEFSE